MCARANTPVRSKTPPRPTRATCSSAAARWGRLHARLQGGPGESVPPGIPEPRGGREGSRRRVRGGSKGRGGGAPESWESRARGQGAGWGRGRGDGQRWRPRPPTEGPPSWWGGGGKAWQREARARIPKVGGKSSGRGPRGAARGEGRAQVQPGRRGAGTPAQGRQSQPPET